MARPRYNKQDLRARQKLENAFWMCLDEMPYEKMTVATLVEHAGVNRNTFYYYFDNVEDMARTVFDETVIKELPTIMLNAFSSGKAFEQIDLPEDMLPRIDKLLRVAKSDSPYLTNLLAEFIRQTWLKNLGLDYAKLNLQERIQFEFVLGGMLSGLKLMESSNYLEVVGALYNNELGHGVMATISGLGKK